MPNHKKTGSLLVRYMPLELRVKLKILAASRGVTMEKLVIELLTKAVKDATE